SDGKAISLRPSRSASVKALQLISFRKAAENDALESCLSSRAREQIPARSASSQQEERPRSGFVDQLWRMVNAARKSLKAEPSASAASSAGAADDRGRW